MISNASEANGGASGASNMTLSLASASRANWTNCSTGVTVGPTFELSGRSQLAARR